MSKYIDDKKPSRKTDVLSFFQNPPSKNTHSFHASSSFEQYVIERDVNPCENASDVHIMDGKIGSSSDQGEINVVST